jgi:hypothetical protein
MFDGMRWTDDTVRIGDVTFDLADAHSRRSKSATTRPRLLKDQELVGDYRKAFGQAGEFRARRIFELGLWDGGSAIFWCELAQPELYIGIDTARPAESQALSTYVASGPATRRIVTRWGVAPVPALRAGRVAPSGGCRSGADRGSRSTRRLDHRRRCRTYLSSSSTCVTLGTVSLGLIL